MSLTSYRAAPPRVTMFACSGGPETQKGPFGALLGALWALTFVNGLYRVPAGFNAWRRPTLPTLER